MDVVDGGRISKVMLTRLEAWRMDRGPYPFRWMAELEFPIERMTKDGPR